MKNISINGEYVCFFTHSKHILVFDILFNDKIRKNKFLFENNQFPDIREIESKIFDWSDGELLGFYKVKNEAIINIDVADIKYYDEDIEVELAQVFGTDSGIIVIIDWNSIAKFSELFNYDSFIETLPNNYSSYINKIEKEIGSTFSIISTPGINQGYEFCGSGRYYIKAFS